MNGGEIERERWINCELIKGKWIFSSSRDFTVERISDYVSGAGNHM